MRPQLSTNRDNLIAARKALEKGAYLLDEFIVDRLEGDHAEWMYIQGGVKACIDLVWDYFLRYSVEVNRVSAEEKIETEEAETEC